jgi:O-antigen ligase
VNVAGSALRLLVGAVLAWWVVLAAIAPEVPRIAVAAAAAIAAATLWTPGAGLVLTAAVTPAAQLLAAPPVRAAEMLAWTFLAVWLLSVWRPLARASLPHAVQIPAVLYGAALGTSWLMLTLGAAAGVASVALPQFLFHAIPGDHLIFSSPEPETWTLLQTTTGVALLLATMAVAAANRRVVQALAWALVISISALAAATLADVASQWSAAGYESWFLLRYVRGERFSLHLADLNAAGSLYVVAAMVAAAATLDRGRRGAALVALVFIVPALWLTGSRTSFGAGVVGLLTLAAVGERERTRFRRIPAAIAASLVVIAGASAVDWQSDAQGSIARSAELRAQFMETSGRMFASAPVLGVGIGRYFDRSAEFMPAEVRAIYGNENAHNYFAQQFAELGVVGGVLFVWLACALVATGWRAAQPSAGDAAAVGLFAAVTAYLVTCVSGHPLLVPEAALPWWIAAGAAVVGVEHRPWTWSITQRVLVTAACVLLAFGIAREAVAFVRTTDVPPESGFHGRETAPDGTTFRWMTRHAVMYVPDEPGFLQLRLHAPDLPSPRTLAIETSVAGRVVDRHEVPPGEWVTYDVPSRGSAAAPFRRVDLRANQFWTQEITLGQRQARRPIAVMVGEVPVDSDGRVTTCRSKVTRQRSKVPEARSVRR